LDPSWQKRGVITGAFPTGLCADSTRLESTTETVWFDAPRRLVRFRRRIRVTFPDGQAIEKEYVQQKHLVSVAEIRTWLRRHGFVVKYLYGDRSGSPYKQTSERAILWARKA